MRFPFIFGGIDKKQKERYKTLLKTPNNRERFVVFGSFSRQIEERQYQNHENMFKVTKGMPGATEEPRFNVRVFRRSIE